MLKRAGLTSVTFGIETPSDPTLQNYRRQTIDKDRQRAFIASCRELGIRTVAGFMIGFPEDTELSIRRVRDYAMALGPTFANFNVVTPYPGTAFFEQMRDRLGRDRLQPFQRLYADAEVRPPHARADRVAVGEMFSAVLFSLAVSARERHDALAGLATFGTGPETVRRIVGRHG